MSKFLNHIEKYQRWYFVGIGAVLWALIVFMPICSGLIMEKHKFTETLYQQYQDCFFSLPLAGSLRFFYTLAFLMTFILPALLVLLALFYKNQKISFLLFFITIIISLLAIFSTIFYVSFQNKITDYNYKISFAFYINIIFAALSTMLFIIKLRYKMKNPQPTKQQQIDNLKARLEELEKKTED